MVHVIACHISDLLVKSYGDNESGYNVGIVIRVVEFYVSSRSRKPTQKILAIGRFIDDYLVLVARDENFKAKSFQSLVEAMPKMINSVITTKIKPLTCISRYGNFSYS